MGADVICHGSGFVVEPDEMEKALIKPRLAVIRRLIEHGAAATPDLTQAVVDERNESFGELAQFLKMAEDPESAPLILKLRICIPELPPLISNFSLSSKSAGFPPSQIMNVLPRVGFSRVVWPVMAPSWTLQNFGSPFQCLSDLPSKMDLNPASALPA